MIIKFKMFENKDEIDPYGEEKWEICECPEGVCFLDYLYPNSEAGLACDSECYLSQSEKNCEHYKKKYHKQWSNFIKGKKTTPLMPLRTCDDCGTQFVSDGRCPECFS